MWRGFLLAALVALMLLAPSAAVAAEVLIGVDTGQSVAHETAAGHMECEQQLAAETGRLAELRIVGNSTANTGVTSVVFGVETEGSSAPSGSVVGEAVYVGTPSANFALTIAGLGVRLTYGAKYWLCLLPVGGALHYNSAASTGGSPTASSTSGGFTKLGSASWTPGSPGPFEYYGLGTAFPTIEFAETAAGKVEGITTEVKGVLTELKSLKSVTEGTLKVSCTSGCGAGSSGVSGAELEEDLGVLLGVLWFICGAGLGAWMLSLFVREVKGW